MGASAWRRRLTLVAAAATVIIVLAQPATAQAPTVQDLQAMEARILKAVHSDAANTTAAVNALNANMTSLRSNVTLLRSQVQALNASFGGFMAANNLTANKTLLGAITAMRLSLSTIQANLTKIDSYHKNEHIKIYGALVEIRENATTHKMEQVPILPGIKRAIETGNLAVRGDIGEWAANMTVAVESLDSGTAAAIQVSDNTNGKSNYMIVAQTATLFILLVSASVVTKRPRRFYQRLEHEKRRVDAIGHDAAPNCPAPPEMNLGFGDWHECPPGTREACPVSTMCKRTAKTAADKEILEDETVAHRRAELEEAGPAPATVQNGNGHRERAPVVEAIPEEV